MKARNGAAGNRDEHQRPDRHFIPFRVHVHVGKIHLRHHMPADPEEHTAHDTERHDDETSAENGIKASDDHIDRQERCKEVIDENTDENRRDCIACQRCKKSRRSRHENSTDENKQNDRENAHDEEHHRAHIMSDNLRDALAIFTD